MPKGKGYFWPGLAQGVAGLYGHNQNERLADKSQAFRAAEGDKDRAQRGSQFDAMFKPPPDTLNPDLDSAIRFAADADDNVNKLSDALGKATLLGDQRMVSSIDSQLRTAKVSQAQARAAAKALQDKTLARQGAKAGETDAKAPKKMGLMEQYLESRKNQGK